jgi:hypothetical protein
LMIYRPITSTGSSQLREKQNKGPYSQSFFEMGPIS